MKVTFIRFNIQLIPIVFEVVLIDLEEALEFLWLIIALIIVKDIVRLFSIVWLSSLERYSKVVW